jgi:cysteine-rich repeat protein
MAFPLSRFNTLLPILLLAGGCVTAAGGGVQTDGSGDDTGGGDTGIGAVDSGPGWDSGTGDTSWSDTADVADDVETDVDRGPSLCGNGVVEGSEVCDDGNNFPGDGCNGTCESDETCANGTIDFGEACDDGNLDPGDGCDAICRRESGCGNGIIERGEQCDDGNISANDGCSPTCQREVLLAADADYDTIADFDEDAGRVDTDGDGLLDSEDADSDNDGIPDRDEAGDDDLATPPVDTDGDGIADFRDTDSDNDGIPDSVELTVDSDGDGIGDWRDLDSDNDFVPDEIEGTVDSDGDGIIDRLDLDSDNDTILDEAELFADSDEDGTPNRLDLDSDNDGLLDSEEAGDADPLTYPVDTDFDGLPDYIDRDSDRDGLGDAEEIGCAAGSSDHRVADTDGDGFSDLAEFLVGANPCVADTAAGFRRYTDFFFILPEGGPPLDDPLQFSSNIVQADVAINVDTTGSMGGEINNLRNSLRSTIVPSIRSSIANTAFAVSDYRDFNCNGRGRSGDYPFRLLQRVTTDINAAQNGVNNLALGNGGDGPESGWEALYQVASGRGVSGCGANVAAFNPGAGRVPGVADGTIGGVGFRNNSFPVVITVTDAVSHQGGAGGAYSNVGANSSTAITALQGIGARVIGVASGSGPRGELEDVARRTGANVRTCAWDGARPGGCGSSQCCTGSNGNGRGTAGDGLCPLVFDIGGDGSGLGNAIVTAVRALVNTTTLTVTTRLRAEPTDPIDSRCFIQSITPSRFTTAGSCTTNPVAADINPADGTLDSWQQVTPGTALFFDVIAQNDGCVEEIEGVPQSFTAYIDVIGDGLTVLDTQKVTIIVPAASFNPTTVP